MDFITADEKIALATLLTELRAADKVLIQRIAEARALGDLRENAEYHASREDKAMNDAKIKQIEGRIANAQVADSSGLPDDMVFVGATGRLDLDYIEVTTTSPMGMSLMKARVGEVVRVDLPRGEKHFTIVEIV